MAIPPAETRALPAGAADYPPGLHDLEDAPEFLYIQGQPLPEQERSIAIVGSRAATRYGQDFAYRLAADLARIGYVIVSGLARGIDAAAHHGALDAGGTTVAVLPGGLDQIAPRHHAELARRIAGSGTLATEHPSGTNVFRHSFLNRNRLIAAISAATVVVEAATRSGALTTAAVATRLGRPVLAVPGDVDRETSRGCHELIRHGALLCESSRDVVSVLQGRRAGDMASSRPLGGASCAASLTPGLAPPIPGSREARSRREEAMSPALLRNSTGLPVDASAPIEARVLACLSMEPQLVDQIARAAGVTVPETLAALLALGWSGLAIARPGQRWVRK